MSINKIVNVFVNITFINVEVHGLLSLPNAWVNMKGTLMTVDFSFILNRCIFAFKSWGGGGGGMESWTDRRTAHETSEWQAVTEQNCLTGALVFISGLKRWSSLCWPPPPSPFSLLKMFPQPTATHFPLISLCVRRKHCVSFIGLHCMPFREL